MMTQFYFQLENVWPIGPFHNALLLFSSDVFLLLRAEPADSLVDCPMSQHMSRHQNTTKNIQQTTHVMTLNATYDIGQFDI